MCIRDRLQTWYELYAKPHLRFSTAEYYRRGIELHIVPRIGDIPLKKLTGRDLQWLYKDLQEHGRLREAQKGKQPGLSASTIRGIHTMLHNALDRAVKERLIVRNPADDCIPPKIQKHEMKILPPEQIRSYLTAADQRGVLTLFYLELISGCLLYTSRLVLRKDTVDQRDQLSLEVTSHVDQIEAVPAQLLQRQQTILCDVALGIAPETDQLGDDEGIFCICFDLADEHIPHGAGLDRVEQNDVVAVLAQPRKERQPVMRGGLHRKYDLAFDVRVFSDFLQHEIVPGAVVADREWTLDGLAVRCNHTDLVAALGDIDTDNEHNTHLNIDLQTVLMVL